MNGGFVVPLPPRLLRGPFVPEAETRKDAHGHLRQFALGAES